MNNTKTLGKIETPTVSMSYLVTSLHNVTQCNVMEWETSSCESWQILFLKNYAH